MKFFLHRATILLLVLVVVPATQSFSPPWSAAANKAKSIADDLDAAIDTKTVVSTVAVAGATGRTGRLVVEQLLERGVTNVVALVRDEKRASEILPSDEKVKIVQCDLGQPRQIQQALRGVDAAIWCATGFSDAKVDPFEKFKRLLGVALKPKQSIDAIGLPAMAEALARSKEDQVKTNLSNFPKIVMCSSAGVTRPTWNEAKKKRFSGSAEIPIVRLNPFGILDIKRESEQRLRSTCQTSSIPYCIVRPGGLNDKWPAGSRPIFSQGDVAVGRINRQDVAKVLVDALTTPEAVGKTFELFAVAGYPPAPTMRRALSRLAADDGHGQASVSEETLEATYNTLQQLLPGEQQDSAGLAMGQTYEELDKGKTGRLGVRGKEDAEAAAPKPSSL